MNEYWKEIFGWSWSRQKTWDACRLRYYYSYIGKWEGFKGDTNRERLQWLSRKTAQYMLEGQLVHEAIRSQINQWAIGRPINREAAKRLYEYELNRVRKSPRDFLINEINGFPINDEKYDKWLDDGLLLLDNFFDIIWPNYDKYKYVQHEDFDSFKIEGIKVWTKVDLVTKMEDGTIMITDWKTGKVDEDAEENRRQLLGYALWAMEKFGVDESLVHAEVRFLRDPGGNPRPIKASKDELEKFRAFILENAKEMLSVKSPADFPPNPSERMCQECAFATVCPEGASFVPTNAISTPIRITGN